MNYMNIFQNIQNIMNQLIKILIKFFSIFHFLPIRMSEKDEEMVTTTFDDQVLNNMLDCKLDKNYIPIIYRQENNISVLGLEKYHRFDPSKYMHSDIFNH
jgi:hypothetical protein